MAIANTHEKLQYGFRVAHNIISKSVRRGGYANIQYLFDEVEVP